MSELNENVPIPTLHHVDKAHEQIDVTGVTQLTVDETSMRKGHDYNTVVCQPGCQEEKRATRVLFVAEGKEATTVKEARIFLEEHGLPAISEREVAQNGRFEKGSSWFEFSSGGFSSLPVLRFRILVPFDLGTDEAAAIQP